jgi:hypothetical protein
MRSLQHSFTLHLSKAARNECEKGHVGCKPRLFLESERVMKHTRGETALSMQTPISFMTGVIS